ncbi:MAG: hypothetical protein AAF944_21610 [Bacteroidota bacterium]
MKNYKKAFFKRLVDIFLSAISCISCTSDGHYERLVGSWTIVEIESRAEPVNLDEVLDNRSVTFTGWGNFRQGTGQNSIHGEWKILGDRLQLIQPEITDVRGKILFEKVQQEWELTLSEEWMIWWGTALNDTQHLKIMLRKQLKRGETANHL